MNWDEDMVRMWIGIWWRLRSLSLVFVQPWICLLEPNGSLAFLDY